MPEERWQSYIDQIIEEARARGEFDPPPRKGERLKDGQSDVYEGSRAMANKVLANSGHAPPFLMKKREIEAQVGKERDRLLRYVRRRQRLLQAAEGAPTPEAAAALRAQAERDWQWAVAQFEKALPEINEAIGLFNLMNQIPSMHKMKLRIDREIERAEAQVADEQAS